MGGFGLILGVPGLTFGVPSTTPPAPARGGAGWEPTRRRKDDEPDLMLLMLDEDLFLADSLK